LRSALLVLILTGILPARLFAEDQRFAFAVPEAEGRISLGVYDGSGKLVRILFSGAEEKDFQIGLNGLLASWDGKDDHGAIQPAGKYHIRGWLVAGSIKAEGVAYHFNDWIVDDASPEISGIGAVAPGGKGHGLLVFGFSPGREAAKERLWSFLEERGLALLSELPAKAAFLAGMKGGGIFFDPAQNAVRFFPEPEPFAPINGLFVEGTIWKENLVLRPEGEGTELVVVEPLSGRREKMFSPASRLSLDASADVLAGWTAGKIWLCRADAFESAPIEGLPEVFDLSVGPEQTLWVAGRAGEDIVVRQHAFGGELLREMKIREEFATEVHVFASKSSLSFYLLLQSSNWNRQTLRGYQPAASSPGPAEVGAVPVDWEVFLDKTIENSRRFGLRDGKLVADAGDVTQPAEEKIGLPFDSLTGKKSSVTLRAMSRPGGLWLAAKDGLPLKNLSEITSFDRFVVTEGKEAGSLRLFAGNGVVVAEYLLTGLDGLAAIDAGEIELP